MNRNIIDCGLVVSLTAELIVAVRYDRNGGLTGERLGIFNIRYCLKYELNQK